MPTSTQVLVNSGESIRATFYVDGNATDPDGNTATVTITKDSDGSAVATNAATTRISTGTYAYALQPQAALDRLKVVWSGTFDSLPQPVTTYLDIVGGYFVTLAELRAMPNLSDPAKFSTAELIEARQWFETLAEHHCGRAFVPRYKKLRMSGSGTSTLLLDMDIRSVRSVRDYTDATTYTAFTAAELADIDIDPLGNLTRLTGSWRYGIRNLVLVYEHGMDACPDNLRAAAKDVIRNHLLEDHTGHQEYALQTDVGIIRFERPGPGAPTGNRTADTVLNSYRLISVA